MRNDKKQTTGTIMILAGGTCWGFSGCCGQYLFEQREIKAPWLVVIRLFFAGIILALVEFKLHGKDSLRVFRKKRSTIYLPVFAIFSIISCRFTYFMATRTSNVGTTTVLQYLSPILTLAVMRMRELRLPKGLGLAAIGPSLFGTFATGTHGGIHSFHIIGEVPFWGPLVAVSSMIHIIIPGGLILKYNIYQMLGFSTLSGGIAMGAAMRPWNYGVAWDASMMGTLAGMVVVGTAIVFGLCLQSISMIGLLKGSIMGSVEPMSAVVISVFWLGIRFVLLDFLGFALILGAVLVPTPVHRPGGEAAKGADFSADS